MSNQKFYTYAHYKADSGEIFYIGKGTKRRAYIPHSRSALWESVVEKHGFRVEIIERFDSEQEALDHEVFLIAKFRSLGADLCNITNGGEGVTSESWTPELRAMLSAAHKGKHISDETRKKMSESAKGRPMSPEAIEKTASFHRGRKRSQETIDKMSAALKGKGLGRKRSPESIEKVRLANLGSKRSDEQRAKMSASAKGSKKGPMTQEHKDKISQKRREYWAKVRLEKQLLQSTSDGK